MKEEKSMTHRERIVRTLLCERTDRPPFPIWLGFAPWGETLERWRQESGIKDLDIVTYFGFEHFFHCVPLQYGPFPGLAPRVLEESPEFIVSTDWRGITARNRRDGGSMPEYIRHPIQTRFDWDRYKAEQLQPRIAERTAEVAAFAANKVGRVQPQAANDPETLHVPVQVGVFPWGVFGTARDMLGAEELLLAFYDEEAMVRDIMATYTDLWIKLYEEVAKHVQIDHIHIWEDMSGKQGSLISMAMIEDFMMPHYDRIAAFARAHKVPLISVDSDGLVDELVPTFMKHGVNVIFPFEVQAGNDICKYRRLYPKLGILGGLDKNALAKGRKEIHAELDKAGHMFAQGGYIVGFDHMIPPDVPWVNFDYTVQHIKKLIGI